MLVTSPQRTGQLLRKAGTFMIQGKVEICGVNTSKLPLLKNAEKEELFKKIEQGDQNA